MIGYIQGDLLVVLWPISLSETDTYQLKMYTAMKSIEASLPFDVHSCLESRTMDSIKFRFY